MLGLQTLKKMYIFWLNLVNEPFVVNMEVKKNWVRSHLMGIVIFIWSPKFFLDLAHLHFLYVLLILFFTSCPCVIGYCIRMLISYLRCLSCQLEGISFIGCLGPCQYNPEYFILMICFTIVSFAINLHCMWCGIVLFLRWFIHKYILHNLNIVSLI